MKGTNQTLTKRSVAGVLWTGLSVGIEGILQLLAVIVLARLLAPSDFGLFAAALIVVGFSKIFSGLGVGPAIVQRAELLDRHVRVGFTLSILFSLAIAGVVCVAAPGLAVLLRLPDLTPVVRAASLIFVCQGISMVAQALAQRALRFRWLAAVSAGSFMLGFAVVAPALAWHGYGVWALIGALLVQHASQMVLLLAGQPHAKRPLMDLQTTSELLYFGSGFTLARLANYLANQSDKLVVGRALGAPALGLYTVAYQVVTVPPILVGQVLDRVLFPAMALVQKEPHRLARAFCSAVAVCAVVTLPLSIMLTLLSEEIAAVLFGEQWSGAVLPLQILALGMMFRTSSKLSDSVARATGAVYARAWRQGVFAANIVALSIVGQFWGIRGVAIGVVIALICNWLLMAQLSLSLTGVAWRTFAIVQLPGIALAALLGAVTWGVGALLRPLGLAPYLVLLAAAICGFVAALMAWRLLPGIFLGAQCKSLLRSVAAMAPPPLRVLIHWIVEWENIDDRNAASRAVVGPGSADRQRA